ncbi:MAG: type II secretion system protein [Planctomycetota bacterium]
MSAKKDRHVTTKGFTLIELLVVSSFWAFCIDLPRTSAQSKLA